MPETLIGYACCSTDDQDLAARSIKLSLGGQVNDPTDPMGKVFFNILATFRRVRGRPAADEDPRGHGCSEGEGQAPR